LKNWKKEHLSNPLDAGYNPKPRGAMPQQKAKIKDTIIVAALQFLFINGCLIALMLIWDSLPKYVGGVLLFALPMAVGIILGKILEHRYEAFSERTGAVMVIVITSILLWLPGIYPGLYTLKDYLQTARQETAENMSVHSFHELYEAGFVSFGNGYIDSQYNTTLVTSKNVKHGDIYTRVYRYFYVTPVLWQGWTPDLPVGVFAVRDSTSEISSPFDNDAVVQGLVVRDPHDVSHYRLALQQAETDHGIKIEENPLLLVLSLNSYEDTLRTKRLYALIAMGLVNLILIGPVVFFGLKRRESISPELDAPDYQEEDIEPELTENSEAAERESVMDLVETASYDSDSEVRHEAILELGHVMESSEDQNIRNVLFRAVNLDSDRRNRIAALEILAKQHDESTFTYILGALMNDESPEVRLRAIELMGASDNPLATRALEDSAKNDRDDNVRQAARDMAERRKSNANP
jgi:hypothetical protein